VYFQNFKQKTKSNVEHQMIQKYLVAGFKKS